MSSSQVPYFLWDYNLTHDQVKALLASGNETDRLWLTGRILSHARFEDVWKYLHVSDVVKLLPKLRMRSTIKRSWQRALNVWGYNV